MPSYMMNSKSNKKKVVRMPKEEKDNIISDALHTIKVNKDTDNIVRVYIEEKSVTAYKTPIVNKPDTKLADVKTFNKENYPNQPNSKLPDVFPELPDNVRAYLKLWPYGDNLIINKKQISKLYKFYFEARNLPLPSSTLNAFKENMDALREILNLCTMDEMEEAELKQGFESSYPKYTCKCNDIKKKK